MEFAFERVPIPFHPLPSHVIPKSSFRCPRLSTPTFHVPPPLYPVSQCEGDEHVNALSSGNVRILSLVPYTRQKRLQINLSVIDEKIAQGYTIINWSLIIILLAGISQRNAFLIIRPTNHTWNFVDDLGNIEDRCGFVQSELLKNNLGQKPNIRRG